MGDRIILHAADGTPTIVDTRTVSEAQAEAVDRIRAAYERELARGMPWAGKTLQIDDASINRLTAVAAAAANGVGLPPGFAWRMADNSALPLTQPAFVSMASAAFAHVNALRQRLWAAVDTARAAPTREDADKVAF
jgi:hypothetical protein